MLTPWSSNIPSNPIFLLAQGDLFAKLGRKPQALQSYTAAGGSGEYLRSAWRTKIESLADAIHGCPYPGMRPGSARPAEVVRHFPNGSNE